MFGLNLSRDRYLSVPKSGSTTLTDGDVYKVKTTTVFADSSAAGLTLDGDALALTSYSGTHRFLIEDFL